MSYNRCVLMGNLTRDPETRSTSSGTTVVTFGLAMNEKIGPDKDVVTFVDVTMFGKRGEAFARFHSKGDRALIEGKLRLDQWEDKKDGRKRSKLYVIGDSFEFAKAERGGAGSSAARAGAPHGEPRDEWGAAPSFESEDPSSVPF